MRVKLDENIPRSIATLLGASGHDVSTVHAEGLVGRPDLDVAEVARREDRLVITLDRGFPALPDLPPTHPGVVVFKLADQSIPAVERALATLLARYSLEALRNCICVVSETRIRIRRST